MRTLRVFAVLTVVLLCAAPGGDVAAKPLRPQRAGAIQGTVTTDRKPEPSAKKVTHDAHVCGRSVASEDLVVKDGRLANAVVWVKNPPRAKAPPRKIVLDQQTCRYVPHVQATTAGSTLVIKNSDATLHNVHAYDGTETLFNLAMPVKNQSLEQTLDEPGLITFKCDAGHTWMSAYVHVFDHPFFAVTGPDGTFTLAGLPPGAYEVTVWHETLGTRTATATVAPGKPTRLDLRF